ncbi:MAG: rhodanese-related sulfurtransferase [Psychromonas sp.]|jgi:rhodanese-related sulfurtransferase|uniref:rhodanese-like domain-containing protein n=1 Tax=Psychromonas sp. TaxID=1884585 RepID=UPI0039E65FE6
MSATAPEALPEATQYCPTTSWNKINSEEILLLDVRETQEVEQLRFDVPNYLNIPLSQLEDRFAEVPQEMPVIVACLDGSRSLKATYYLMFQGYSHVANMKFGLKRWVAKRFPVIGSPDAIEDSATGSCCSPADTGGCC